jgi:hypothetical protein
LCEMINPRLYNAVRYYLTAFTKTEEDNNGRS